MTTRTREWLRGFLNLGARAEQDGIPNADIERQEDTVLRALDILEYRPGVVLADEVGLGKTYEALGIAAITRHNRPRSRIVIVTPGPDLNKKWFAEFARFENMYGFGTKVCEASRLSEFVKTVRQHRVVVAPVTMFQSGRGTGAQTYLLSLYFHWKGLHGHTANAIMARFRDGGCSRVRVGSERFLGIFTLDDVLPHLAKAFVGRKDGATGLDDLYEGGGLEAFKNETAVRNALYRARFVLTGQLMPMIDLLIVDEAHKLKNPGALRTRAMHQVFEKRFRKALFLTATPFQLDVGELREVFSLFAGAKGAPKDLLDQVDGLLASIREYQRHYDDFQQTWSSLDPLVAAKFCTMYDRDPCEVKEADDPSLILVARQIAALRELKERTIEPGLRQWMIRSRRENKGDYREHVRKELRAAGVGMLPFLIYERFVAELFRRGRQTHKAAVEINMVSSYAAAQHGAILARDGKMPVEAEVYRALLEKILDEFETTAHEHPKLQAAMSDTLDAADQDLKTLIFCSRIATLQQLRRELDATWESRVVERWRRVYPGAVAEEIFDTREEDESKQRGRHSLLQARFHKPQDALYLALREPYLRTIVPAADWALEHLPDVVREANALLRTVRVGKTAAERTDYQVAKRCVEQAAVKLWLAASPPASPHPKELQNLRDPAFLRLGLDLVEDEYEKDPVGEEQPQWSVSERVARMVLGTGGSLWEGAAADSLNSLEPELRVRVVEQLARYLTFKHVPFLPDLLLEAVGSGASPESVASARLLEFVPDFWRKQTGQRWMQQMHQFIEYFVRRDPAHQIRLLDGPLKTVSFARHTRDGESRERLREAFNTPLFPMILIANEVMQEGLDLHRYCRRIIHHDLVWNPAQIEQRIGRIDRLGSLTDRLRKNDAGITLEILYPVIRGTIDQRLFRTVKTREKWLEFLLGAPPNFSEYSFTDDEPPPLPNRLPDDLAISLGPK